MTKDTITISSVADMEEISKVLDTDHSAWPCLNVAGNLCGVIGKSVLIKLLEKKAFYKKTEKEIRTYTNNMITVLRKS